MKYEYTTITSRDNPLEIIESYTSDGWECFSVSISNDIVDRFREFYFKRPIQKMKKVSAELHVFPPQR